MVTAYRFSESVKLYGVEIQVCGTYDPAEPATRDYPGSGIEVNVTTATIGGTDVSDLIDAGDWWADLDEKIIKAIQP